MENIAAAPSVMKLWSLYFPGKSAGLMYYKHIFLDGMEKTSAAPKFVRLWPYTYKTVYWIIII